VPAGEAAYSSPADAHVFEGYLDKRQTDAALTRTAGSSPRSGFGRRVRIASASPGPRQGRHHPQRPQHDPSHRGGAKPPPLRSPCSAAVDCRTLTPAGANPSTLLCGRGAMQPCRRLRRICARTLPRAGAPREVGRARTPCRWTAVGKIDSRPFAAMPRDEPPSQQSPRRWRVDTSSTSPMMPRQAMHHVTFSTCAPGERDKLAALCRRCTATL